MRFNLYRCQLQQAPLTTTYHLVAASEEHGAIIMDQHIDALGLERVSYSLERVDQTLPEAWGGGELDDILENAPAGLVSYTEIGWVAHTAPVHRLRLFNAKDRRGRPIYAIAPNVGVALTLMVETQLPNSNRVHSFAIRDVTDTLPDHERKNLDEVLAAGQAGMAKFDEERGGWSV